MQPYIALAKGLRRLGHETALLAPGEYGDLAREHQLEIQPLSGCVQDIVKSDAMGALLEKGRFIQIMRHARRQLEDASPRWAREGLAACEGCDVLISGLGGLYLAAALAEALGKPLVQAYLSPFTPTSAFPGVLLPPRLAVLGGGFNRLSHHLVRQVMWRMLRQSDALVRKELRLPPCSLLGPYSRPVMANGRTAYGFSRHLTPRPRDWDASVTVAGYWFLEEGASWTPPRPLAEFLEGGEAPVYIGFGSMHARNREALGEIILGAVRESGVRAVVHAGSLGPEAGAAPDHVHVVDAVPHSWLFPRMAAVVHHGGAGTTGAGARAGRPALVVPFFGDQPFWGARIAAMKLGPPPLPRRALRKEALARSLRRLVEDETYRMNARELGESVRLEDGVRAVHDLLTGAAC